MSNDHGSDILSKENYIVVKAFQPPVAGFSHTPEDGLEPLTVQFTDESSGNPTSWSWDFGDDTSSIEQNPSHTYNKPGTYTVTLTVTNAAGSDTLVDVDCVEVLEAKKVYLPAVLKP